MVRFKLFACTLVVSLVAPQVASAVPTAASVPAAPVTPAPASSTAAPTKAAPTPAVKSASPSPSTGVATAPIAKAPPEKVVPDWRARVAIGVNALQAADAARYERLHKLQPDRKVGDEMVFTQTEVHDPAAAPVLLRRLLQGSDPVKVRCALVDALPHTGGDWQEGAAALAGVDASPTVRKKLIEVMRYADPPHSIHGLRLGFKDENQEVNIAAARTAAFSRGGLELVPELYSSTFDTDWDLRAAAVQALGMLKLPQSREVLIKALYDEEREVRLQALVALEQLDPVGIIFLPEIDMLARDRKSHRIARKADLLLQQRRAANKAAAKQARQSAAANKQASKPKDGGAGGDLIPVLLPVKPAAQPATAPVQGTH